MMRGKLCLFLCTGSVITSRVSGRGHRTGAVCLSVCEHSHGRTIWPMTLIFGMGVDLPGTVYQRKGTLCSKGLWITDAGGASMLGRFHFKMRLFYSVTLHYDRRLASCLPLPVHNILYHLAPCNQTWFFLYPVASGHPGNDKTGFSILFPPPPHGRSWISSGIFSFGLLWTTRKNVTDASAWRTHQAYFEYIGITIYCLVPGGRGLQLTARPLSRDETRSINPLVLHRWTSPNLQREPPTCWVSKTPIRICSYYTGSNIQAN